MNIRNKLIIGILLTICILFIGGNISNASIKDNPETFKYNTSDVWAGIEAIKNKGEKQYENVCTELSQSYQ